MNKIYAHRGLSTQFVPNSIEAIKACINKKYIHGIEIDIRMTKDKHFVLFHDEKIDGSCPLSGKIYDYTLEQLKKTKFHLNNKEYYYKLFNSLLKKEDISYRKCLKKIKKIKYIIPTLQEVINIIDNKELLIEIKVNNINEFDIYKFYNIIKLYTGKKIYIQSFNKIIIDKLYDIDKNLNLGLLLMFNNIDYSNKYKFYSIEYRLITKHKIDSTLIRKKQINLWTINYCKDIKLLMNNIDEKLMLVNYISDNPKLIYETINTLY